MNRAGRRRAGQGLGRAARARAAAAAALSGGDLDRAEALLAGCVADAPGDAAALHDLGVVAARRGRHAEASERFRALLAREPDHASAWRHMALSLGDAGRHGEAVEAARRAVALRPRDPHAHAALGHVMGGTDDLAGAAAACGTALALDPAFAPAHLRRARIFRQLGDIAASLASCDALIRLNPGEASGHIERGTTLIEAGRRTDADDAFRTALAREPASGDALMAVCAALLRAGDVEGAMATLDRGAACVPDRSRLDKLRALLLQKLGRLDECFVALRDWIERDPDDAEAHLQMGILLLNTERLLLAVPVFELAIRLKPDMILAYEQLADCHRQLGNHSVAVTLLDHAVAIAPGWTDSAWLSCWSRMHACAWSGYGERIRDVLDRAVAAGQPISPFIIMAFGLPDHETLLWSRAWAERGMAPSAGAPVRADRAPRRGPGERIRVGYLSADFRGHATASLVTEVFRLQDRARFELFGYNIGRGDGSAMGGDLIAALDHIVDLSTLSDRIAAERIAADDIDILVDLKGFTAESRPAITAHRPAAIQVNYLGYPGTMGSRLVDYIIADPVVAPFAMQPYFDEAIVHLPHSYQPNDRRRPGPDPRETRAAHGLPEQGFVFCCFNNSYKLTPLMFDIWMRVLHAVPGAVLWLFEGNDTAATNLRAAAVDRGVPAERVVFAPRLAYERHLARLGLADLFLDTLPVNAHTTASEALWCGVPVLTCPGTHFTSRVAASLLHAAGLPELIMPDLAAYEREAIALVRDPARLDALRARLVADRLTCPLFDAPRYVRNYEAALERMVELHDGGVKPQPIAVPDFGPLVRP